MKYRPNDDEAAVAAVVARRRNSLNGGGTNIPGGETADERERFMQHYQAALAEIAVSRMINRCWTGCGKGASGLKDVGGDIEVRSISDPSHGLLARKKDDDRSACVLVFVSRQDRSCTALGWEYFSVVKKTGRIVGEGTESPCWILKKLQPMETLKEYKG